MKVYLAGPMRGWNGFNRDKFRYWAEVLRADGHEVFSPAEHSEEVYGKHIYEDNPDGDEARFGINPREVFEADLVWICRNAEAIAVMPMWGASKGACAEYALAVALGLKVIFLDAYQKG